eukprot:7382014-Prymnesium_polylepis.4
MLRLVLCVRVCAFSAPLCALRHGSLALPRPVRAQPVVCASPDFWVQTLSNLPRVSHHHHSSSLAPLVCASVSHRACGLTRRDLRALHIHSDEPDDHPRRSHPRQHSAKRRACLRTAASRLESATLRDAQLLAARRPLQLLQHGHLRAALHGRRRLLQARRTNPGLHRRRGRRHRAAVRIRRL